MDEKQEKRDKGRPNINFDLELGITLLAIALIIIITYAGRFDLTVLF